jgi:hypothetical protein
MADRFGSLRETGFGYLRNMAERICRVTTMLVPDGLGVDLQFINKDQGFVDLREEEVNEKLKSMYPRGGTEIGRNLEKKVLKPLVYKPLESGGLKRPLLISIITDGQPAHEPLDTLKKAILNCKDRLDQHGFPPYGDLLLSCALVLSRKLHCADHENSCHVSDQPDRRVRTSKAVPSRVAERRPAERDADGHNR